MPLTTKKNKLTNWQLTWLIVLVASFIFIDLAEDVWLNEGFAWDAPLMLALHGISRSWLDTLFIGITQTAGGWVVVPLAGTAVYLWRQRESAIAIMILFSFTGAIALNTLLKSLFARPRPQIFPPLMVEYSFSFPSGHTMSAVAFYGLLAILLWHNQRRLWATVSGLWVLFVAISRVYLGVHYPSDVLASLAVGTIWLILIISFYQDHIINHGEA